MHLITALVTIACLCIAPLATYGAPSCHCFQQQSYERNNSQNVEAYLFATTNNSLLAVLFEIPRRAIVKAKMSGTSDADLWLSLSLAKAYPVDIEELQKQKNAVGEWSKLAQDKRLDPERLAPRLFSDLVAGVHDEALADRALAEALEFYLSIAADISMSHLRNSISRQKLALSVLLAKLRERDLNTIIEQATANPGGWTKMSERAGIVPGELEAAWLMVLDKKRQPTRAASYRYIL